MPSVGVGTPALESEQCQDVGSCTRMTCKFPRQPLSPKRKTLTERGLGFYITARLFLTPRQARAALPPVSVVAHRTSRVCQRAGPACTCVYACTCVHACSPENVGTHVFTGLCVHSYTHCNVIAPEESHLIVPKVVFTLLAQDSGCTNRGSFVRTDGGVSGARVPVGPQTLPLRGEMRPMRQPPCPHPDSRGCPPAPPAPGRHE